MPDEEDWLWRPFTRRLCTYKDIMDPSHGYTLEDIARMNDICDVQDENEYRHQEALARLRHG